MHRKQPLLKRIIPPKAQMLYDDNKIVISFQLLFSFINTDTLNIHRRALKTGFDLLHVVTALKLS